jgi:phospholipase/lecithinase/hemolysin
MASVVVNIGRAINQHRLKGTAGYVEPNFLAWGTGAGVAAIADTTLFTEAPEARVAGTTSVVTTTVTDDTYRVQGTLTATAARSITNVGTFDAAKAAGGTPGGRLHQKADFASTALNTNDTIQFIMDYQIVT